MLQIAGWALRDLTRRSFRVILWKSVLASLACLAALWAFGFWIAQSAVERVSVWAGTHWVISWIASAMAGVGLFVAIAIISLPMLRIAAALFSDEIVEDVERRSYPMSRGKALAMTVNIRMSLRFLLRTLVLNLVLLPIAFIPLVGQIIVVVANGYNAGLEYFSLASLRKRSGADTDRMLKRHRGRVWFAGLLIAGASLIPFVNILVPAFAMALMTHVENELSGVDTTEVATRHGPSLQPIE